MPRVPSNTSMSEIGFCDSIGRYTAKDIHAKVKRGFQIGLPLLRFVFLLSVCVAPVRLDAADAAPISVLIVESRDNPFYTPTLQGFKEGLKRREKEKGLRVDFRVIALSGRPEADAQSVRKQLQKLQLLVTLGTDATRLAAQLHPAAPILFSMILDPVSLGVAESLDAPGGGFTGTTLLVSPGKQLDALLQADPKVHRIGVIYTDQDATSLSVLNGARKDAERLHLQIAAQPVKPGEATKEVLKRLPADVDALWVIPDPASTGPQALTDTLAYAQERRLPILGVSSGTVRQGALLALSANLQDLGDVTAEMGGQLLDGSETPAKMHVRGPRKTVLTLNMDAARALGVKLPDTMLHLADEVIDSQAEGAK